MGFKIVSRYQRIKCVYFKTLNDALIFWITTKLTLKTKITTENISISVSQLQIKQRNQADLAI